MMGNDDIYKMMCDIVASDRLVCVTGAGISSKLHQEKNRTTKMPEWLELLLNLRNAMKSDLGYEEDWELQRLLVEGASGIVLIEAASILRKNREKKFDRLFRDEVTSEVGETTDTHRALLEIHPRGIITFNYDLAHENALNEMYLGKKWDIVLPSDEDKIKSSIFDNINRPFLLKAHGSVNSEMPLVLTRESYRDIFNKYPVYRAFVQNILTNFDLLIVGFGLSDPDFDMFIQDLMIQFGSPLRKHIVIRREIDHSRSDAIINFQQDVLLRRRFGIYTYYVSDYESIPKTIRETLRNSGPNLNETINKCLSKDMDVRNQAHKELQQLGLAGKSRASAVLRDKIEKMLEKNYSKDATDLSELVYSLGKLDVSDKENKIVLISVVEKCLYVEPVAHALVVIQEMLNPEDFNKLDLWQEYFRNNRLETDDENPDHFNRIPIFVKYLKEYVYAKYIHDDSLEYFYKISHWPWP